MVNDTGAQKRPVGAPIPVGPYGGTPHGAEVLTQAGISTSGRQTNKFENLFGTY